MALQPKRTKGNGRTSRTKKRIPAKRGTAAMPDIKYEIIIYWSQDDQAFIAEVPELAGCAADGATYREAIENAEVVIREWIETSKDLGRSIPTPRGRPMFA